MTVTNGFFLRGPENAETRLFINNEFVTAQSGKKFDVINPATEELTASVHEAQKDDVDLAVAAAKTAFPAWSRLSGFERAKFFYRLADLYEASNSELARLEAVSMGKPVSSYTEGISGAALLRYFAGKATDVQGESSLQTTNFVNLTFRQPYGVCAAIVPWNAPVVTLTAKMAPCLISGNTLVAKMSEKAPLTGLFIAKLIKEAGFPPGVVNILNGMGIGCGSALASHMEVRKLSFTGSVGSGKAVKRAAAESNLKNVSLELGGKSPLIVFEDADLDKAALAAAKSILGNSGQQCVASSRVYVQSSIAEAFKDKLVIAIQEGGSNQDGSNPLSPKTKRGPQADKAQFDRIMGYLGDVESSGGKILAGGEREGGKGYYIQPTIVYQPDEKSKIMREEIFGPIQCVSTFETEEEVLERANDTEFGLYASVFTKDLARALRIAKDSEAGSVGVNVASPFMLFDMPFGGWKSSGDGVEFSTHGLNMWTQLKTVYMAL